MISTHSPPSVPHRRRVRLWPVDRDPDQLLLENQALREQLFRLGEEVTRLEAQVDARRGRWDRIEATGPWRGLVAGWEQWRRIRGRDL